MPPGPYRATTCRGRELNCGSQTYFLTPQGHGGPPRMSDQPDAGATSETIQKMKKNTYQSHIHSYQQGENGMMITAAK